MTSYKLLDVKVQDNGNYLVTVEHKFGWGKSFFGKKSIRVRYCGGEGIWREMPTLVRCLRPMEERLENLLKAFEQKK